MTTELLAASYVAAVRSNGSVSAVLDAIHDGCHAEIAYEIQEHTSRCLGVEVPIALCEAAVTHVQGALDSIETRKTYRVLVNHIIAENYWVEADSPEEAAAIVMDDDFDGQNSEVADYWVGNEAPLGVISVEEA